MRKRTSVLGVAVSVGLVLGTLTMASGCVGPSEAQEQEPAAESEGEIGTTSQAVTASTQCGYAGASPGGLLEAQKRATKALRYVLGANNVGEQYCSGSTRAKLDTIRNAISNGELRIDKVTSKILCSDQGGVQANMLRLKQSTLQSTLTTGPLWDAFRALAVPGPLDDCFGQGASTLFVLQTWGVMVAGKWQNYAELDPEPAILRNNWGTGSSSAAALTPSGVAVTAYRFSATQGSSCSESMGGMPCTDTTTFMSSGDSVMRTVTRSTQGFCKCPVLPP